MTNKKKNTKNNSKKEIKNVDKDKEIKSGKIIDEPEKDITKRSFLIMLVSLIIIFSIVFGSLWYSNYHKQKVIEENSYNGFSFYEQPGGLWLTRLSVNGQLYNIPFYNHPRDLKDIAIQKDVELLIKNPNGYPKAVYISVDPNASSRVVVGGVEIARITGNKYNLLNIFTKSALHYNPSNDTDTLVVNCSNSNPEVIVLYFDKGTGNAIYSDKKYPYCIHLDYVTDNDSIRIADRFAYQLLNIMN